MRFRYGWDERKIAKRRQAGYGMGVGGAYKPWLTVADVPSKGRVHRVWCEKTGREHHLLSDNEYFLFLDLWWDADIVDIREQYPLPRLDTRAIALHRGVRHPVDIGTKVPLVLTTDFMVTKRTDTGPKAIALSMKPFDKLLDGRVRAKLDLERTYWLINGVEWRLVTDRDVRNRRTANLDWLYGADRLLHPCLASRLRRCEAALAEWISTAADVPVRLTCARFDVASDWDPGTSLSILRAMLRRKSAITDLHSECIQDEPGRRFQWK